MVKQAHNERNYHIFYQLVNGADTYLAQLLEIDSDIDYSYLRTDQNDDENFKCDVRWIYSTHKNYYHKKKTMILDVVHFCLGFRL